MRVNPFSGPLANPPKSGGDATAAFENAMTKARGGKPNRPTKPRPVRPPKGDPKPLPNPTPRPIGPPDVTTMAAGEEGPIGPPVIECPPPKPDPTPTPTPPPDVTTLAVGEEGGGDLPVCELPPIKPLPLPLPKTDPGPIATTLALGEEGDPGLPVCELPKPIWREPITWPREQPITLFPLPGGGVGAKGPFLIEDPAPMPKTLDRSIATKDTDADNT